MSEILLTAKLPVLALRGLNAFPNMTIHFDVGRKKSIRAVEEAMRNNQEIFLVTQKDIRTDDPGETDLYTVGTVAVVKQFLKLPGDLVRVLVEGKYRARLTRLVKNDPFLFGQIEMIPEHPFIKSSVRAAAMIRQGQMLFDQYTELSGKNMQDSLMQVVSSDDPGFIADFIAQHSSMDYADKQKILELLPPVKRLETACVMLARELDIMHLEAEIQEKVQEGINKGQRDYYLREQLRVIRDELGEEDDEEELLICGK